LYIFSKNVEFDISIAPRHPFIFRTSPLLKNILYQSNDFTYILPLPLIEFGREIIFNVSVKPRFLNVEFIIVKEGAVVGKIPPKLVPLIWRDVSARVKPYYYQ